MSCIYCASSSASESVKKIFDLEFACRREVNKAKMAEVIDKYKLEEDDTSSIEVQGMCRVGVSLGGRERDVQMSV